MAGMDKRAIEYDEHAWFHNSSYKFRRLNTYGNDPIVPEPAHDLAPEEPLHNDMIIEPEHEAITPYTTLAYSACYTIIETHNQPNALLIL